MKEKKLLAGWIPETPVVIACAQDRRLCGPRMSRMENQLIALDTPGSKHKVTTSSRQSRDGIQKGEDAKRRPCNLHMMTLSDNKPEGRMQLTVNNGRIYRVWDGIYRFCHLGRKETMIPINGGSLSQKIGKSLPTGACTTNMIKQRETRF